MPFPALPVTQKSKVRGWGKAEQVVLVIAKWRVLDLTLKSLALSSDSWWNDEG